MKYTKHGKLRAAERGISKNMVRDAILEPTHAYYDLSTGATVVFKKLDEKHLLVVYSKSGNEVKVITTFIISVAQEVVDRKPKSGVWVEM